MAKDNCVVCGKETAYDFETHIDMRIGYVEGVGQLCKACYSGTQDVNDILIPFHMVENTPNDFDLGEKVRAIYWKSKNV